MDGSQAQKRQTKRVSSPPANPQVKRGAPAPKKQGARARTAPPGETSEELVKYVLVELDVPRENHQKFQAQMPDLVELMFDHVRWELVFASYPITGRVNRFVHIWRIPDESTLVAVMRDGALDLSQAQQPDPNSLEGVFRLCYMSVQELIERTTHVLMTSLPYDPTHVGFQSQTILIDAEGEAFMIDHAALRSAAESGSVGGLCDVAEELELVRRAEFTRVSRSDKRLPKDAAAVRRVQSLREREEKSLKDGKPVSDRVESLKRVQQHLNRGSAVARVTFEGTQALLFNLAGLKPKSVFQAVELDKPAGTPKLGAVKSVEENGVVDTAVDRLLIAMPWGGVYDVKSEALQQLARPIPADRKPATDEALAPILADFTPMAAIPSERDGVIGDGCACHVINLSSFKCC
jgi:hypothetical protein